MNEIFQTFIRTIFCLFGNCLVQYNSLNISGHSLPFWKIPEFFSICGSYQAEITQVIRSFFTCEKFPSLFTSFYFLFSWYFKIVWPQVCFRFWQHVKVSQKCRRKCYRSVKERNCHKSQIVVCVGLGNFPKLSTEKIPRLFSFILIKVFKIYVSLS